MDAKIYPVDPDAFAGWDGTIAGARRLQRELAARVRLVDDFAPPRLIAGVDVGFEEQGTITRAAAVLLDAQRLVPQAEVLVRRPTTMPYVPGLLSFRELPALLEALRALPEVPQLVYVDGHGIAHPRRLGIAAHLGVASGLPTIGVAKTILVGTHAPLGESRGARTPLLDGGTPIGTLLRSKDRVAPLIVSPGHRVSLATAPELVLRALTRYRLPEPTRLADRLASQREAKAAARRR
ncbi:deoxyribonuclease V [Solimonas soli]|uniref:deoxyribonuclease V n=1 Tax=Solimonas soli TaxID=413479 RepID=UPI0004BCF66A|nr:deoxyribonuclease V [Solimonas soli]